MSTDQLTFPDLGTSPRRGLEGRGLRDQAIARAAANAPDGWMEQALRAVGHLARQRREFTTDDVWAQLEGSQVVGLEPRAMGAVMTQAQRDGVVVATSQWRESSRPVCHGRPVRVWRAVG